MDRILATAPVSATERLVISREAPPGASNSTQEMVTSAPVRVANARARPRGGALRHPNPL